VENFEAVSIEQSIPKGRVPCKYGKRNKAETCVRSYARAVIKLLTFSVWENIT
jgi:hypothetical protein